MSSELLNDGYTLYYSLRSPFPSDDVGHKEEYNDLVDALSGAFRVRQEGGNPTRLVHAGAVLFSGNDLEEVLERISENGGRPDVHLTEIVRQTLPAVLTQQLVRTVKSAHEHFGAVAVYRSMLEELYEAADQALQKRDLELLNKITGTLAFHVPSESSVKQWGKDFLHAYRRDAGWLRDTKKALEKIKKTAKELEVAGVRNEELKAQLIKAAEDGLITHI